MSLGHTELDRWLTEDDRLIVQADWRPLLNDRFQPTTFPNLGAAEYTSQGETTLVVDSPQSMANRLEGLSWDEAAMRPRGPFQGLPYVEVRSAATGQYLTSSRQEAHRLSGAWLRGSKTVEGQDWMAFLNERLGLAQDVPLDWRRVCRAVSDLDPFSLTHGVFFSDAKIHGQPKIPRAITATMDALRAKSVTSGGVKKDAVGARNEFTGGSGEGYGSIPYPRVEYTAEVIRSLFVLDVEQLRSYGLDAERTEILFLLGVWEIAQYVAKPRRHRTFCDLAPEKVHIVGTGDLPSVDELEDIIRRRVPAEAAQPLVLYHTPPPKSAKKKGDDGQAAEGGE